MKKVNLGCGQTFHHDWLNIDFSSTGPGVIAHDLTSGLPLRDDEVDVIYCSHVLEHLNKKFAPIFLKECFRVLRKGGVLRIAVPDLETITRLYLMLLERARKGDAEAQGAYDWIMIELFDQMVRNVPGGEFVKHLAAGPLVAESFIVSRAGKEATDVLSYLKNPANAENVSRLSFPDESKLTAEQLGNFRRSGEVHQWMYDSYSLGRLISGAGFGLISTVRADESKIPEFNSYCLDIDENGQVRKPDSLFMEAVKPVDLIR
ncbi:class I SAM-dependent methyltransferase [Maridesulfovibrio zosterae]|uniref:class I SAM-dependent methyltransferase n=1 Tax=Maridesulfovibrio zosterae TaxID=82171 RepID=UPI0003F5C825|nr:methyltransferase domain-containing protein [Maridesulfovibrio zosterae]